MVELRIIRSGLEKVGEAFEMYEKGTISPFILSVNIRQQADGLRAFHPVVGDALAGLADNVAAAGEGARAKAAVGDLSDRFRAWRRETLATLEAEQQARPEPAPEPEPFEFPTIEASKPAEAPPRVPEPEPARPAPASGEEDAEEMSMEEIERILEETTRKL